MDQAESLRRMLAPRTTRRIAVLASERGAGATTVALGLSHALAMQGERVLLVDEDAAAAGATRLSGARPGGTLADVQAGRLSLEAAVGVGPGGVLSVLPAGRPVTGAALPPAAMNDFRSVLVDAGIDADGALSPLAGGAHNVLVVMRPELASITAAYACIKRLHHLYAWRQFHLIVNLAASEATVQAILRNLARTASQYLGVEVLCAGWLPADPLVARAVQLGRCVVEAFPAAPATAALRRSAGGIGAWPLRANAATPAAAPAMA
ncbi:MinD/ParA family ATP-binding protein [Cupriavidus taiwanensis]|uniref:MinD/ParA family ATP-binding protein n=1 Tax=Cupriavidus taiwanensis TaxID=164546 RepID=UPI000E10D90F|nr:flagellar synthesis regulator MotR [Cupriavidus taiwanensis]SOY70293.1 Putative negative regulator of flagellin synthesis [Cupriavidus taiwanensis]SOY70667.1 Putative negative regulator of flagellin synthesis [Cupriavidus taiwanensis]SOY95542.1 Putative negative regulator of flagellin synthesis [Cupriavidus taiwanensis]SOZ74332.1 Putative negative regulator of flagellin synthesis [Cupriavidus taiwanensis]SOZ88283.1 Putative negative regulator of flagellin synthesis [Cupriavidus taiwanensis]